MSNKAPSASGAAYDLTPSQAAEILEVHWSTVNRWADQGRLACKKTPGGWRRYRRADVEEFAAAMTSEPTA